MTRATRMLTISLVIAIIVTLTCTIGTLIGMFHVYDPLTNPALFNTLKELWIEYPLTRLVAMLGVCGLTIISASCVSFNQIARAYETAA